MSFHVNHLRLLREAAILDLGYVVIGRPNPKVIIFPDYFLLVDEGKIVRNIEELPQEFVLQGLKNAVRDHLPGPDRVVVYESQGTRVYTTEDIRGIAHALCAPSIRWSTYTETSSSDVKIWHHYYWPPIKWEAEIWVYPRPQRVEVKTRWEPEWTFIADLKLESSTVTTVVAVLNGVLHEIIRVTPIPSRRRGWRRAAK